MFENLFKAKIFRHFMKKIFIFLSIIILSMSFVFAQNITFKQGECMTILPYKDNIVGLELPNQIPLSTEIINIYIGEENYGFVSIKDKKINDFNCLENKNATYELLIENDNSVKEILEADSPIDSFLEKLNSKEINLKGRDFGKKIKAGFLKFGLRIFSWFN